MIDCSAWEPRIKLSVDTLSSELFEIEQRNRSRKIRYHSSVNTEHTVFSWASSFRYWTGGQQKKKKGIMRQNANGSMLNVYFSCRCDLLQFHNSLNDICILFYIFFLKFYCCNFWEDVALNAYYVCFWNKLTERMWQTRQTMCFRAMSRNKWTKIRS